MTKWVACRAWARWRYKSPPARSTCHCTCMDSRCPARSVTPAHPIPKSSFNHARFTRTVAGRLTRCCVKNPECLYCSFIYWARCCRLISSLLFRHLINLTVWNIKLCCCVDIYSCQILECLIPQNPCLCNSHSTLWSVIMGSHWDGNDTKEKVFQMSINGGFVHSAGTITGL